MLAYSYGGAFGWGYNQKKEAIGPDGEFENNEPEESGDDKKVEIQDDRDYEGYTDGDFSYGDEW